MPDYAFGGFVLNSERLLLSHRGEPVPLGPKVVATLLGLVERPGEVIAKAALLDRVWPDGFVEEANLTQNVHVLRKTFRAYAMTDPIATVPRRGYRFTAPVRVCADARGERPGATPKPSRRIAAAAAALAAALAIAAMTVVPAHRAAVARAAHGRLLELGTSAWNVRTAAGIRLSLEYFAQAVEDEPRDARGYAALGAANVAMGEYCYGPHDPAVYFARARAYADRAIALDQRSAEAHAVLGILAVEAKDFGRADAELRQAIALGPTNAAAHEWYGVELVQRGRLADGMAELETAARLDPLSVATAAWLAHGAYRQARFADAVRYAQHALELSPGRTDALATLGAAYEARRDYAHAIAAFRRYGAAGRYYRPEAAVLLAHAYALAHRMPEARAALAYARQHPHDVDVPDLAAAVVAVRGRFSRLPARRTTHASMYA